MMLAAPTSTVPACSGRPESVVEVAVAGEDLAVLDPNDPEPTIQPLVERLQGVREREQKLYNLDPQQPYEGHIVLQVDKAADFLYVRKIIGSGNEAGWSLFEFATKKAGTDIAVPE